MPVLDELELQTNTKPEDTNRIAWADTLGRGLIMISDSDSIARIHFARRGGAEQFEDLIRLACRRFPRAQFEGGAFECRGTAIFGLAGFHHRDCSRFAASLTGFFESDDFGEAIESEFQTGPRFILTIQTGDSFPELLAPFALIRKLGLIVERFKAGRPPDCESQVVMEFSLFGDFSTEMIDDLNCEFSGLMPQLRFDREGSRPR